LEPSSTSSEVLTDAIQQLSLKDFAQRWIRGQALSDVANLRQMPWLMYEQSGTTVSMPLLVTLLFWLTINFVSFGLFTLVDATAITTLFISPQFRSRSWRCARPTKD